MKKYRIWDKSAKRFLSSDECSLHCFSEHMISMTGILYDAVGCYGDNDNRVLEKMNEGSYLTGSKFIKGDRYIVQYCTGMLDIIGNEIYEGDRIFFEYSSKEVYYSDKKACFMIEDVPLYMYKKEKVFEVIGHINQ